ncbi:BTAD domain-containing putative transcriptional regulator [Micromonospora sp. NPDC049801]|uniref:AfsR/SARP family transcriptional regulator n=1 Tax=unclassified Micromonospora TaxID=2617518 RepID=UPI0033E96820
MNFEILGTLGVKGPTGTATIRAARQRIVLVMLLLEAGRVVPVDRLSTAIWDDAPPQTARGQIQICVSALRRALADVGLPDRLETCAPGYLIHAGPDEVDLLVFERLVAEGRQSAEEQRLDEAIGRYERALKLWRGDALAGVESRLVAAAGARLEEMRLRAVEEFMDLRLRQSGHQEMIAELADLVASNPLREHLRAQLMLALFRSGRQGEALACYRDGRQTLVDELGIEPSAELREVERAVLGGETDYELDPRAATQPADVTPADYRPARLLPPDIGDYTGNRPLLDRLQEIVTAEPDDGNAAPRIISVSGTGGVGKSALAIRVAHATKDFFPDGQLYARLNGNNTPLGAAQVLERFLRALGVPHVMIPGGIEERAETLRALLSGRRVLMVLDEVADEEQVRMLVPNSAPSVVILTSRRRLTALPAAHHVECPLLEPSDSVELLAQIAGPGRIYAEPTQALRLSSMCGHLPLALRAAGGRLLIRPHWTVARMAERFADTSRRLDELSHGEQSLRANIAPSYEWLSDPARRLLRLLGVLEARDFPEWICAPLLGSDDDAGAEALSELVTAQLLEVETPVGGRARFRMHGLIRIFAAERHDAEDRAEDGAEALRRALGAWLYVAEKAHRSEYGGDHTVLHSDAVRWKVDETLCEELLADPLEWFAVEKDALVAMVGQAADLGADDLCWDLAVTLVTIFEVRSEFVEWRATHDSALAAVRRSGNKYGEAAVLYSMGALAAAEYRLDDAARLSRAADELFVDQRVLYGRALVLRNLAFIDRAQGRHEEARRKYEQAREWFRFAGDVIGEAHVLSGLAQLAVIAHDRRAALGHLTEAIRLTEGRSRRMEAQLRYRLGEVALKGDDIGTALDCFHDVLEIVVEYGDRIGEAYARYGQGLAQTAAGDADRAVGTLRQAGKVAAESGDRMVSARIQLAWAEAEYAIGSRDMAARLAGAALQSFRQLGDQVWQARGLRLLGDTIADTATAMAAWREALTILGKVDSQDARDLAEELVRRLTSASLAFQVGEAS